MSIKLSRDLKYLAGAERDLRTVTEKVVKKAGIAPVVKRQMKDISSIREELEMAIIFYSKGQYDYAGDTLKSAFSDFQDVLSKVAVI